MLNEHRDQARPAGYPPAMPIPVAQAVPYAPAMPIVPAIPAVTVNDPRDAAIAELHAQLIVILANQAQQTRVGRAYAYDSDEELEPFAPHISNTPFPHGFKLTHLSSYDGTTDSRSHFSTF